MTPEHKKRVAEITTGKEWEVLRWKPFGADLYQKDIMHYPGKHQDKPEKWSPRFDGQDWQRSQALAMLQYIAKHKDTHENLYINAMSAVNKDDMEYLQSLVLELSDE